MFNNKSILITGGTGSFGQSFTDYIVKNYKPKKLIIFSRDEFKQYTMSEKYPVKKYKFLRFFIGDVRDKDRLKMATKNLDYIVHTAALKQVNTAEYNPQEFIQTNIQGAQNVIEAALQNNVKKIIALSTDKAANPINLYGATKLVSDKVFIAANNLSGNQSTRFSIVRYGNVLNSRGSVVPFFKNLSKNQSKEFPITHEEMTRFWISLKDSVKFVIDCVRVMKGGEIFVPKIPSVKIVDIAKAINPNMKLKIVGLRPGEKLHEILCPADSSHLTIEFKKYFIIKPEIVFFNEKINYLTNIDREKGKIIKKRFEYNSINNPEFLTIKQIKSKLD
tara:strand:- start:59 stop:1057 length:999 start_codon:yes stop_codon:yes gene_type:complete